MKKATREWVRKAEDDYQLAAQIVKGSESFYDQICFHCQQAAEKYLKGLLEEIGATIPKTHNLDDLYSLILPHQSALRALRRGLIFLTDFAVGTRYPGQNASKRQAAAAWRWATKVRDTCRMILGVLPPRSRKT